MTLGGLTGPMLSKETSGYWIYLTKAKGGPKFLCWCPLKSIEKYTVAIIFITILIQKGAKMMLTARVLVSLFCGRPMKPSLVKEEANMAQFVYFLIPKTRKNYQCLCIER